MVCTRQPRVSMPGNCDRSRRMALEYANNGLVIAMRNPPNLRPDHLQPLLAHRGCARTCRYRCKGNVRACPWFDFAQRTIRFDSGRRAVHQ